MKEQIHLGLECLEGEYIFSKFSFWVNPQWNLIGREQIGYAFV